MRKLICSLVGVTLTVLTLSSALASSGGDVVFAYQGRVKVHGTAFTGNGQFKLAVVNTAGNATLWSNDGTGTGGSEPAAPLSVAVPVVNGVFNIMVGDSSQGMDPINGTIFNSPTPLKLRVWFSDGTGAFEQLSPDQNLGSVALRPRETQNLDFTLYVNSGPLGNDSNSGLKPSAPKKTIQAAVDSLPDRIRCNITIDIADGFYPEEVNLHGISVSRTKTLRILGDEAWLPSSTQTPAVVISGADTVGGSPVRAYCVFATQCSGVVVTGLHCKGATRACVWIEHGDCRIENCLASDAVGSGAWGGIAATESTEVTMEKCLVRNTNQGIAVTINSRGYITDCISRDNLQAGFLCDGQSSCWLNGPIVATGNETGVRCRLFSALSFQSGTADVSGNTYGLSVEFEAGIENYGRPDVHVTGNTTNVRYIANGKIWF